MEPEVEPRLALVLEPAERASAPGVVDEDVDRAPLATRGLDHPLDVGAHRNVGADRDRVDAEVAGERRRDHVAAFAVDLPHEHARAVGRESPRDRVTDPVAGSRHDRDPILQASAHRSSS